MARLTFNREDETSEVYHAYEVDDLLTARELCERFIDFALGLGYLEDTTYNAIESLVIEYNSLK